MPVTMKEIAARAGVTRNAVAAVLNNTTGSRVSAAKRELILSIAKELDYQPSFAAKALKGGRTGLLGFVCSNIYVPFIAELVMEFLAEAERNGYKLLVFTRALGSEVDAETLGFLLGDGMLEGLFLFGEVRAVADAAIEKAGRGGSNLLVLSGEAPNVASVAFDYDAGMKMALGALLEKGHRRIAFSGSREDVRKLQTYQENCALLGIEPLSYIYSGAGDVEGIQAAASEILERREAQTALVGTDYGISIMANVLREGGLRLPEDLSLMAFNNSFLSQTFNPPLTSISIDKKLFAAKALERMRLLVSGSKFDDRVRIAPELVWRRSVVPPR